MDSRKTWEEAKEECEGLILQKTRLAQGLPPELLERLAHQVKEVLAVVTLLSQLREEEMRPDEEATEEYERTKSEQDGLGEMVGQEAVKNLMF